MINRPPAVEAAIKWLEDVLNPQTQHGWNISALLAYIRQLEQAAPVWQPIETAPRVAPL